MKTLIYDERVIREFYRRILGKYPRGDFDTDFFCVAARKKYMTEEERQETRLGDTTLLEKTVLKRDSEDEFVNKVFKVDSGLDWVTALNGNRIPRSCEVFYINVNHTSTLKALKSLQGDLNVLTGELLDCLTKRGTLDNIGRKVKGMNTLVLKAYQDPKNVSDKTWIDLDVDVPHESLSLEDLVNVLEGIMSPEGREIIVTRGGYHVLVDTRFMSSFNKGVSEDCSSRGVPVDKSRILSVDKVLKGIRDVCGDNAKEVKINSNGMVPLPGTIQGGKKVLLV